MHESNCFSLFYESCLDYDIFLILKLSNTRVSSELFHLVQHGINKKEIISEALHGNVGAFLAGVLVAESKSASIARITTVPLRDMFAALFFISIGALMDISLIPVFLLPAAVLILVSFASKFLIVTGILVKAGYGNTTSLRTGFGMSAAKGELSLVVVKGGQDVGVVTASLLPILGVVTIVTTVMTPYIIRFGAKLKTPSKGEDKRNKTDAGVG